MTTTNNNALSQAKAQYDSIASMVAALNVDYDRLEELRDEVAGLAAAVDVAEQEYAENMDSESMLTLQSEKDSLAEWEETYRAELAELEEAVGDCEDSYSARERIQEDALDVQVRSDWHNVGGDSAPSEFMILLCTGGPAVRIMGELDEYLQPCRAWIEAQDWGTGWEMLDSIHVSQSVLLEYCQQFYFGE